ncbi:MAG: zinc ribbon domain-containing protein [Planctomycetes bacterium]|nr:zinc ribbon domain-containing protein [Planctomycetota bacterium]
MSMCPYCGEDVPAGSNNCWKCGLELDGDTDSAAASEGMEIETRGRTAKRPQRDCPHCGEGVSVRAIRCNACGERLTTGGGRNWIAAAWLAFVLIVIGTVVGLVYNYFANFEAKPDPGRLTPVKISRAQLHQFYKADSSGGTKKKRGLWQDRHEKRFVVWSSYVHAIEEDSSISLGDSSRGKADVRLVLKDLDQIDTRGLKVGKSIKYSARLLDYDKQGVFSLDLGVVEEETD